MPEDGIKLWKEDDFGKPILPNGEPKPVRLSPMKGEEDIKKGLTGFIDNWRDVSNADKTGRCCQKYAELITYWEGVRDSLSREEVQYNSLVRGFWPRTRQAFDQVASHEASDQDVDGAEDEDFFIGQRYLCPERAFQISRDCRQGYFVLVKPAEGSEEPVWMGLAESDPNLDVGTENFKHILL